MTVDPDGVGRCTIRGAARIVGVDKTSIYHNLKTGGGETPSKLALMLMEQGFEGGGLERFTQDGIPDRALSIIIQYYALDAGRYCTEQAKDAYKAFAAVGVRAWIWKLTGYQEPKPAAKPEPPLKLAPSRDEAIADFNQATFPLFPLRSTDTGCTIRVGIQDFEPSSNSIRTIGQFALCSTIVPVRPLGTQTRCLSAKRSFPLILFFQKLIRTIVLNLGEGRSGRLFLFWSVVRELIGNPHLAFSYAQSKEPVYSVRNCLR